MGLPLQRLVLAHVVFGGFSFLLVQALALSTSTFQDKLAWSCIALCACDGALHYFNRVQMASLGARATELFTLPILGAGFGCALLAALVGGLIRDILLKRPLYIASSLLPLVYVCIGFSVALALAVLVYCRSGERRTIEHAIADIDGFALGVFAVMGMEIATKQGVFSQTTSHVFQILFVIWVSALTTIAGGIVRTILVYAPPNGFNWANNKSVFYYWALGPCSGLLAYYTYVFLTYILLGFTEYASGHPLFNVDRFESDYGQDLIVFLYFLFGFGSGITWLLIREFTRDS